MVERTLRSGGQDTVYITPSSLAPITVTVTSNNGFCTETRTHIIKVYEIQITPYITGEFDILSDGVNHIGSAGDTVTLTGNGGASIYNWTVKYGNDTIVRVENQPTFRFGMPDSNVIVYLTGIDPTTNCPKDTFRIWTLTRKPKVDTIFGICEGTLFTLRDTVGTYEPTVKRWVNLLNNTASNTSTWATNTVDTATYVFYTADKVSNNPSRRYDYSDTVRVFPIPYKVPSVTISYMGDTAIHEGDTVDVWECNNPRIVIKATPVNGGDRPIYDWYQNGVIIKGNTTQDSIIFKSGEIGYHTKIFAVLKSNYPCVRPYDENVYSGVITINENPRRMANVDINSRIGNKICENDSVSLFMSTDPKDPGTDATYYWTWFSKGVVKSARLPCRVRTYG